MSFEFSGLLPSTPEGITKCASGFRVQYLAADEIPGWENRLETRTRLLMVKMRKQNQRRSDCQGQATANGAEAQHQYCTGEIVQFSDSYAYQGSERLMGRQSVGRDSGSTIESGVLLRTEGIKSLGVKAGLPLEENWPYEPYERNVDQFESRAKIVVLENTFIAEHGPLPEWSQMLISLAAGGVGHIGTYWPFREVNTDGYRTMTDAPEGGGGHATAIIGAIRIGGVWFLVVWNSHNYGAYLMSRSGYDELQNEGWKPFGGYLIMPDKPIERYHDRVVSGGGYFRSRNQGYV
jgi:hypothetical protein